MYEIYFSVSHRGFFLFRTDVFLDSRHAERCEQHLKTAFSGVGYEITRSERLAAWTVREVRN